MDTSTPFCLHIMIEADATQEHVMPDKRVIMSSEAASARDEKASSLIPMLIAGLVLVVIGGVAVMIFV